jgi:methionyl-tRNA formyltransferase
MMHTKHKVLLMGTPQFAQTCFEAFVGHPDFEVVGVVCQPDKKVGRGQQVSSPPVKQWAQKHGYPIFQPEKVKNNDDFRQTVESLKPDVLVVVAYGKILPKTILESAPHGAINIHGSLLPKYRGAAPIQWAIIKGEKETGVTMMKMDEGMDTGPMLHVASIPIKDNDTSESLFVNLAQVGQDVLKTQLKLYLEGQLSPVAQDSNLATMAPMLNKTMASLDLNKNAQELDQQFRGQYPWPGATLTIQGELIKVHDLSIVNNPKGTSQAMSYPAGQIIGLDENGLIIQCGMGTIQVNHIQLPNKPVKPVRDLVNGYPFLKPGNLFD